MADEEIPSYSPPIVATGASIGASNTELSKFMLEDANHINNIILKLSGYNERISTGKDGQIIRKIVYDNKNAYDQKAIDWMERKLYKLLYKGTYLSQYNREQIEPEMLNMAWNFCEELYLFSDEFNITPTHFIELNNIYDDSISFALRRAVGGAEWNNISRTSSETTSIIKQDVNDARKRGLLDFITKRN